MTGFFKAFFYAFFFLPATLLIPGCTSDKKEQTVLFKKKYSIYAMMKNGGEYMIQTDTITSGFVNPEKAGAKVVPGHLYYDLIVDNNYYYQLDWKTGRFIQYEVHDQTFKEKHSVKLAGSWAIDNYNKLPGDTLLLLGHDQQASVVRYAKIHPGQMKASEGTIAIPGPAGTYNSMSIGFSNFMNGRLYLGYSYHHADLNTFTTSDTVYVDELSYPEMKPLRRFKDARSSQTGGYNTRQSHSFTDEKGNFYFNTTPGIAMGNNPEKPTGIFRINKSDGALDSTYFFNISASPIRNHGYGFWYIGNGKAIIRTERKGLFTGMKDHYRIPHFDFYVLDLARQTTSRLDLPLDKGTARQCVLVENGIVYISVNPNSGGSYIWIYDPKTGSLRKGLKFDDQVNYILRLERLNEP